jgi:hypothetical protein
MRQCTGATRARGIMRGFPVCWMCVWNGKVFVGAERGMKVAELSSATRAFRSFHRSAVERVDRAPRRRMHTPLRGVDELRRGASQPEKTGSTALRWNVQLALRAGGCTPRSAGWMSCDAERRNQIRTSGARLVEIQRDWIYTEWCSGTA